MVALEDVLAFGQLMQYMTDEQKNSMASSLGMSLDEINKRLQGKDKEDEFILILFLMDVCKKLTAFDEGISKLLSTATADLLVELKNGKKFLLEIKHTDKEIYKISGGNLDKRIQYAKTYNLDLYFAISIKGFWLLLNSEYIKAHNGKIGIGDMLNSELDDILGTVSYIFPNGLSIKSVYSTNTRKGMGIYNGDYGELISYEMTYKDVRVFRAKGKNSPYIGYTMILEALQDNMSVVYQSIIQGGDVTVITEKYPERKELTLNMISEYKFLLAVICHTIKSDGQKYTPHTILEELKSDKKIHRIELGHVRVMMQELANLGVDMKYVRNSNIYKLKPMI